MKTWINRAGRLVMGMGLAGMVFAESQTQTQNTPQGLTHPTPTASVTPAIGGPMPEQQGLPVNSKQIPSGSKIEALDADMAGIQKSLKSKRLAPAKRKALEQKLGELNAERLSIPASVAN